MSGYCLFWTMVWTWLSKSFQLIVWTETLIVGFFLVKAAATSCQYCLLLLLGPVP